MERLQDQIPSPVDASDPPVCDVLARGSGAAERCASALAPEGACARHFAAWCGTVADVPGGMAPPALGTAVAAALARAFPPGRAPMRPPAPQACGREAGPALSPSPVAVATSVEALLEAVLHDRPPDIAALADRIAALGPDRERLVAVVMPSVADGIERAFRDEACTAADRVIGVCHLRWLLDRLVATAVAAEGEPVARPQRVVVWSARGDPLAFEPALHAFRLRQQGIDVETLEGAAPERLLAVLRQDPADALLVSCREPARSPGIARHLCALRGHLPAAIRIIGLGRGFEEADRAPARLGLDMLAREPSDTLGDLAGRANAAWPVPAAIGHG